MARADRERWNERHRAGAYDFAPPGWLLARAELLRPAGLGARALDLACGSGRNALYLASLGYSVDAWDISEVALEQLGEELERRRAGGERLAVTPYQIDLDEALLPCSKYDLVLDAFFLDRSLFPGMATALRPEGLLLVHTLMRRSGADERNPAYLLEEGELRRSFPQLQTIEYAEDPREGWAHLVARA